jgi:hypothetical protein
VNNESPPILAALIGDERLYKEALRLFWSLNYFCLDQHNFVAMRSITQTAAENIRKLKVEYVNITIFQNLKAKSKY